MDMFDQYKDFKFVNRVLPSLNGGALEITLSLKIFQIKKIMFGEGNSN